MYRRTQYVYMYVIVCVSDTGKHSVVQKCLLEHSERYDIVNRALYIHINIHYVH
jgi:hypothetical protein